MNAEPASFTFANRLSSFAAIFLEASTSTLFVLYQFHIPQVRAAPELGGIHNFH